MIVVCVVLTIILVRRATVVATMDTMSSTVTGRCHSIQMSGTGVLYLCGLYGNTVVDDGDVDGTLVRIAAGIAVGVAVMGVGVAVVAGIPATIVVTIIPGAVGVAAVGGGLRDGGKVSGLGVLYLGGVDGHTIVDHRHMVGTVVGKGSDGMSGTGTGSGMSGKVSGLGVLHLRSFDGSTMGMGHMSQRLGVGSIMLSLGGLHIGSIDGHTTVGEWDMSVGSVSTTVSPATAIDRALVQMMSGRIVGGSGMSGRMGGLGVLYLGCVDGNAAVGQHGNVDAMVSVWHIGGMGMAVGSGIDRCHMGHGRSLGQIGAYRIETVMGISGVGHRLCVSMSIHIGVRAVCSTIVGTRLVLL